VFVSIHGAALTNAMFMPQGGKVLELYRSLVNDNPWMNTCYWNLVTASGLDYYYQFCERGTNSDASADNTNIIIDIPKLEENIKLMLG
jgi:capsular polysaccharide biosynthesis protein